MSERVTNVDIEDILSSIRRLVSEETRPPLVRQPPRLVLTPKDRVDAPAPASARSPAADRSAAEDALEARIAELEAMLGVPAGGFEADEGDPFDTPPAVPRIAAPPAAAPVAPAAPEAAAAAPRGEAPPADPAPAFAHRKAQPPVLELVSPVGPAPADPPQTEPPAAPPPEPAPAGADADQDWEAAEPGAFFDRDEDGDLIDEETLREMVRAILREELQGSLGERITRNVRKLVRAEIARALAARDL